MEAGKLRHWLTFQTSVQEQDSDGALVEAWVDAFAVSPRMPCEVSPVTGRDLIAAQAIQTKVDVRIVTRHRPGFAAQQRALAEDGSTIYRIEAVLPDAHSGRRTVTLLAATGVADA